MTIEFLVTPSCTSCRKAKAWLIEQGIPFNERNMFANPLCKEELKNILRRCEEGTDSIISKKSHAFIKFKNQIESMTINEILSFLEIHPELIRRPIIVDDTRLQIGFNDDEIRRFLPRHVRQRELQKMIIKSVAN